MKKKEELYSCLQQDHSAMAETDIKMVPIADLHDFEGHPFKVENDMALFELMQSIEKEGVIVPALTRPRVEGGYELIAGHRRKAASKWAGFDVMPVVIRELDAMKRQGARTDLTSSKLGKKSTSSQVVTGTSEQDESNINNPTMKAYALKTDYDAKGSWGITQGEMISSNMRSDEILAKQVGENRMTIQRYIRLTNLIPKLLDMVDDGKIAFTIAVELSYLTEEQQYELYEVMDMEQCTPSLSQANRIKRMSQSGELDMDGMPEKLFCAKLCFIQNKEKSRCNPDKWSACSFHFFTARILPGHSGQKGFPYNIPVPQQYRVPYVLQGSYLRYGTESDSSHAAALPAHRHP